MGDMGAGHEEIAVPDYRLAAAACRSRLKRHIFADDIAVANLQDRVFAVVFQILRGGANRGELIDRVAVSDDGVPFDDNVGANSIASADLDLFADHRIGADNRAGANDSAGRDNGRRMDGSRFNLGIKHKDTPPAAKFITFAGIRIFTEYCK